LGGAGTVGNWTARSLAVSDVFDEIVLADVDVKKMKKLVEKLGGEVSYLKVNVENPETEKKL